MAAVVGDTVFVHGGLVGEHLDFMQRALAPPAGSPEAAAALAAAAEKAPGAGGAAVAAAHRALWAAAEHRHALFGIATFCGLRFASFTCTQASPN